MSDKKDKRKYSDIKNGGSEANNTSSMLKTVLKELKELVGLLNASYCLQLRIPLLADLYQVKQFCVGLLENPGCHIWEVALTDKTIRWSVAASLFLFRKRIPAPPVPQFEMDYIKKMTCNSSPPSYDFVSFCVKEIRRMFKKGWDRSYGEQVASFTPSTSACFENARKHGGSRSISDRETYYKMAFGETDIPYEGKVKVANVRENGKNRIVTVPEAVQQVLAPLHDMIYTHMGRDGNDWLLRGDAKPKSFRHFKKTAGEFFVSGDYESATDNISLDLYSILLDTILDTTVRVPEKVKDVARKTVRSVFVDHKGRTYLQQRGQLMGNALSFPFLCLINWLAFKYAIPRDVPVKINGDDIVFRATKEEADNWFRVVGESGLVTSKGKTLVDSRFFSLNSTFFQASERVRIVPFIRSKSLFKKPDSLSAFQGQYKSFAPGFVGKRLSAARILFLKIHKRVFLSGNRSLTRGFGLRASLHTLHGAGLLERENFYLNLASEEPLPPVPGDLNWNSIPKGWKRVEGKRQKLDDEFWEEVYRISWSTEKPLSNGEKMVKYWESVRDKTFKFVPVDHNRRARLLKMTRYEYGMYNARTRVNFKKFKVKVPSEFHWIRTEIKEEKENILVTPVESYLARVSPVHLNAWFEKQELLSRYSRLMAEANY